MLGVVAEDRFRSANDIRKLGARRNEMFELDSEHSRFEVPLRQVKKRRVIQQPLSDWPSRSFGIRLCQPTRRHADEPQGDVDRASPGEPAHCETVVLRNLLGAHDTRLINIGLLC